MWPKDNEELIILRSGSATGNNSFNNLVGTGSNKHVVGLVAVISLFSSSCPVFVKIFKGWISGNLLSQFPIILFLLTSFSLLCPSINNTLVDYSALHHILLDSEQHMSESPSYPIMPHGWEKPFDDQLISWVLLQLVYSLEYYGLLHVWL